MAARIRCGSGRDLKRCSQLASATPLWAVKPASGTPSGRAVRVVLSAKISNAAKERPMISPVLDRQECLETILWRVLEHGNFSGADIVDCSTDHQLLLLYQVGQNRGGIT